MFTKLLMAIAAAFIIASPSLIAASPIEVSEALEARGLWGKTKKATPTRVMPPVKTRYCDASLRLVMERVTEEGTGKVTETKIATCPPGQECRESALGTVHCGTPA